MRLAALLQGESGLGYDPEVLQLVIDERKEAKERAAQPKKLLNVGPPTKEEHLNNPAHNRVIQYGSTNPEYLTARIARDRPDILERMKAGEYKSVRAAAIDGRERP